MKTGHFVISIDFELAWGRIAENNIAEFLPLFKNTRKVIERLLRLFEKYNHPVTWAIVGRLIEDPSKQIADYSTYYKGLSLEKPLSTPADNKTACMFLSASELFNTIVNSGVNHEVACHSFEHIIFGDKNCTEADADRDLSCARQVLQSHGIESTSFVFPRNKIGHLHLLEQHGFKAYRGEDITWFMNMPNLLQRFFRQLDLILALKPKVSLPYTASGNLLNVPGHMMFRIRHKGFRKHIPVSRLAAKAIKGLKEASEKKSLFHMWFHPFNFAYKTDQHFEALEQVLLEASRLQAIGMLECSTMKSLLDPAT